MLSFNVSSSNWGRIQTMMAVRMLSLFTPSGFRSYVILEQNIRVFKRYEGHKAHSGGFESFSLSTAHGLRFLVSKLYCEGPWRTYYDPVVCLI